MLAIATMLFRNAMERYRFVAILCALLFVLPVFSQQSVKEKQPIAPVATKKVFVLSPDTCTVVLPNSKVRFTAKVKYNDDSNNIQLYASITIQNHDEQVDYLLYVTAETIKPIGNTNNINKISEWEILWEIPDKLSDGRYDIMNVSLYAPFKSPANQAAYKSVIILFSQSKETANRLSFCVNRNDMLPIFPVGELIDLE